jgi:hypothetical protein
MKKYKAIMNKKRVSRIFIPETRKIFGSDGIDYPQDHPKASNILGMP